MRCLIESSRKTCKECQSKHKENNPQSDVELSPTDVIKICPEPDNSMMKTGCVAWYACGHIYYVKEDASEERLLGSSS